MAKKPLFPAGYPLPYLLSTAQAGYLLSLHPNIIRNLVRGGELENVEVGTGRYKRIPLSSVERYAKGR